MRIEKEVECEEQGLRMTSKPKVENRYWSYRQGQNYPDGQPRPEIQYQINNEAEYCRDAIVDREDRKQEISRLTLKWVPAAWATVERHKPIPQTAHLLPRNEHWSFRGSRCAVCGIGLCRSTVAHAAGTHLSVSLDISCFRSSRSTMASRQYSASLFIWCWISGRGCPSG